MDTGTRGVQLICRIRNEKPMWVFLICSYIGVGRGSALTCDLDVAVAVAVAFVHLGWSLLDLWALGPRRVVRE